MTQRNYNQSTIDVIKDIQLGIEVNRAAAAMVAALTPIFTIVGGPVLLTAFFGKMTVIGGANNVHIEATPTVGATVPIAANLDINSMIVGEYFTITGVGSDAAKYNATATGLCMMAYKGIILPVGTLDYHAAAAEGTMAWTMFYVPLERGAYVAAT
jgi:hypothetical protein